MRWSTGRHKDDGVCGEADNEQIVHGTDQDGTGAPMKISARQMG